MVAAGAGTAKVQQQDDLGTRPGSRRTATSAGAGTATVVRGHKQAVAAAALARDARTGSCSGPERPSSAPRDDRTPLPKTYKRVSISISFLTEATTQT